MKLTIDGTEVEAREGASVLDAALDAGVFIPHICKHPDLEAVGGCRLCSIVVDGEGPAVPACKTPVREGMVVDSHAKAAEDVRHMAMELILATHPSDCTGCPKYGVCELQSMYQYLGVSPARWRCRARTVATDDTNPLITHMFTRCIRCGRCVRACRELRGVGVLDHQRTPEGIRIGIDGGVSLEEAGCRFCGACVEVCPTGSIVDTLGLAKEGRSREDNVVPCRSGCPAHIDIPRYLRHVKNGEWEKATAVVRERVPFPETLGSICTHNCQGECKRNHLEGPLSICRLKRAAAVRDTGEWRRRTRHDALTGKRVAILGAGPAGLTAAYYLAEKGHHVVVFEAEQKAGGQLRYGIPAYRLPDEVLDREIQTILDVTQGDDAEPRVEIRCGERVCDPKALKSEFDAVLVSVGTFDGTVLPTPGHDLEGVIRNTDFLKAARKGEPMDVRGRVVVLGGGNVAYDCARTAVRLGATSVDVCCLEAEAVMTSTPEEREEAAEEGVTLHDAYAFTSIDESAERPGHVGAMTVHKIAKFYFDEQHRPVTELVEGGELTIPADYVIFAVGQKPEDTRDMGLELTHGPYVVADAEHRTSEDGVFAAGDAVTGTKSVIGAIEGGRESAEAIDRFLGGDGDISEVLLDAEVPVQRIGKVPAGFYDEPTEPKMEPAQERKADFRPYECPFSESEAEHEASRCLQCDLRLTLTRPRLWNEY
ncbi:MAG: FAD-dependent oxidoreductase [Olsenella umbonata]|nr:FAD-dependent oxidoreductase [Parafannyhessea umbonata]